MNLVSLLPHRFRRGLKEYYFDALLLRDEIFKNNHGMIPPARMHFVGGTTDFIHSGEEFFKHFIDLGQLKTDESVLDIGCGIGRMAVPLTKYMSSQGRYEGFDIVSYGIKWCRRRVTSQYPHFNFKFADILNDAYNAGGKIKAENFNFPYAEKTFDFCFATSVFTHLMPKVTDQYLSQVARVLKPGGRGLLTFFLLNNESKKWMATGKSKFNFKYPFGEAMSFQPTNPEAGVAYDEQHIMALLKKHGLRVHTLQYGAWSGRPDGLSTQDILVVTK